MSSVLIISKCGREVAQVSEVLSLSKLQTIETWTAGHPDRASKGPEQRNECQGEVEPGAPIWVCLRPQRYWAFTLSGFLCASRMVQSPEDTQPLAGWCWKKGLVDGGGPRRLTIIKQSQRWATVIFLTAVLPCHSGTRGETAGNECVQHVPTIIWRG